MAGDVCAAKVAHVAAGELLSDLSHEKLATVAKLNEYRRNHDSLTTFTPKSCSD